MVVPKRTNRREFLMLSVLGATGTAITVACAPSAPPTPTPAPRPTEASKPAAPAAATPTPAPAKPAAATPTTAPPKPAAAAPTTAPAKPAAPTATPAPAKPAGPQPTATPAVRAARAGAKTTLKMYTVLSGKLFGELGNVIGLYESKHPDVGVELVYTPATAGGAENPKLMTTLAGGQPPDITYLNDFTIPEFWERGLVTDLREHFQRDKLSLSMFYPSARPSMGYKGHILDIPILWYASPNVWNKAMFREAGLDPEKGPDTIEDVDVADEVLTKKDAEGRVTKIGIIRWRYYSTPGNSATSWGYGFGAKFADLDKEVVLADEPAMVEAFEWVARHAKRIGGPEKVAITPPGLQIHLVATGNLGMDAVASSSLKQILDIKPDFQWGAKPQPAKKGIPLGGFAGGWTLFQPKGVKQVDAAWDLMRWMGADDEGTLAYWKALRQMLGRTDLNWAQDAKQDKMYSPYMVILEKTVNTRPLIPVSNYYYQQLNSAMEDVAYAKKTPAQVLKEVQENVTREWQRFKKEMG
ncbi:MAG: extracellular solute-binding protein [Chloroflexi bacterium]|nr:extracellular solute-binding protein [Chloroflexota bacterium]